MDGISQLIIFKVVLIPKLGGPLILWGVFTLGLGEARSVKRSELDMDVSGLENGIPLEDRTNCSVLCAERFQDLDVV